MTTTTLTDRYLHAATRAVPEAQRAEIRRELAERIGDDIDARVEAGADHAQAETDALTALGDPDALAASYLDRPQHLIGPQLYPLWKRLLRLLLLIVVPIVAIAFPLAQTLAQKPFGEIVGSTFVVLVTLIVHLGFWTTLVFAQLDRALGGKPLMEWTPDLLPEVYESTKTDVRWDVGANLVFIALGAVAIFSHVLLLPFRAGDGAIVPLFEPSTWDWLPWYLVGVLAADTIFWGMLYRVGRWDYALVAARTVLSAAYAVPLVWAFATGRMLNPAFIERAGWVDGTELLAQGGTLAIIFAFLTVAIAAIWPIDAFVKARSSRQSRQPA